MRPGEVPCVAHHVTGRSADGRAGRATRGPPAGTDSVWFIRYRDDYRPDRAGWRFVRRELHLQWVEEHPVAVLGARPDRSAPGGLSSGIPVRRAGTGCGGGGPT